MIRSIFAASASPRGARRSLGWLLLAGLTLPLAIVQAGAPSAEHRIGGSEAASLSIELAAGDFLGAIVEQDGIDLLVSLFDPQEKVVLEMDSPDDWAWEEELAWVAEQPGTYRLAVRPLDPKAAPGLYRIQVDGPRPARPEDRTRVEAVREMRAALDDYGRFERRLEHLEKALALWSELGDRHREAETLHLIGTALGELSRNEQASDRFHQAAALWQELGVPAKQAWSEALALYHQGRIYLKQDPRTAFGYLSKALPLARQARQEWPEMRIAYHLGFVCDDLAEKQDALQYFEQALKLAQRLHVPGYEANSLNSLGLVYFSLGDQEKASRLCQQAVELSRAKKLIEEEASALNNLALIYDKSDPARARENLHRSLDLGRKTGDVELQATALSNLAFLENRIGDSAQALELGRQALALDAPNVEVLIRHAIGISLRKLNDLEASRRELETALALSRERQDRIRESLVTPELARTVRKQGDLRGALDLLKSGIAVVESIRTEVVEEDLRARFFASRQDIYGLYTDSLMALDEAEPGRGYDAEALRSSEQARARSLLDILADAGADIREGADPGLLDQERRLRVEVETVEKRRLELLGTGSDVREVTRQLTALLDEYRRVETNLRVSSPRYAALTHPEPLSVEGIRNEVLDGRALLLEYALGEERSFLWAVTPDGLQSFALPPRATIESAARRYYQALSAHPETPEGRTAATDATGLQGTADELSRMLLRPVERLLTGQPLLVVSDGALQYIPFGSLPAPSSLDRPKRVPLVAGHDVVSLPSASVLAVLRHELADRLKPPKDLAVIADPVFQLSDKRPALAPRAREGTLLKRSGEIDLRKLPRLHFSEKEAIAIAALVPRNKLFMALGFQASRATATGGELARYRMVHFATHGLIDSRNPELSSLVLSLVDERGRPQNGFLRLHDIYNLRLNADLVVLSACQTALGEEIRGEGLMGLTRGFMYAGAARVLASLWSVDDRATSELMKRFYKHMISGRLSPAEALRQAQIELSRDPRWSPPYYWAGFSLQGEWR
jgi:CHAT domain-containing protein/tetratricopeptide (TPR) repeat protein